LGGVAYCWFDKNKAEAALLIERLVTVKEYGAELRAHPME
jgi:hypothetical protein